MTGLDLTRARISNPIHQLSPLWVGFRARREQLQQLPSA
jgi:hypothetical protein